MIRVAVSADDHRGLEAPVSPHFGRCPYFILVDIEGREVQNVQAVQNPFYGNHQPGQVPAFIHEQGANIMLTGGMGRRAIAFFQQYGIEAATGASGSVALALKSYLDGKLSGAAPCRESVEHAHAHGDDPTGYANDEVGRLREEAEMLRRQMDELADRLKDLEAQQPRSDG